jgi:hypothetical protein
LTRAHYVAAAAALIALAGCSDDGDARADLPVDNQMNDVSAATIAVFPDKFPNIAFKCLKSTGFYTTTDRYVLAVFDDPACPEANLEHQPVYVVISDGKAVAP